MVASVDLAGCVFDIGGQAVGNDGVISTLECNLRVQSRVQVQSAILVVILDLGVYDWRLLLVEHLSPFRQDIECYDIIVLCE